MWLLTLILLFEAAINDQIATKICHAGCFRFSFLGFPAYCSDYLSGNLTESLMPISHLENRAH
jgi:hypothetical protein